MKSTLKFSIITVCYNSEKTITDTIEAVLKQSYTNYEYIIIDGQSEDATISIIKKYEPAFKGKMKWISEKDNGIYDAMNKGIRIAKGDIISFINANDWYELDALQTINKIFTTKNCDIAYGLLRNYKFNKYISINGNSHEFINETMIPFPSCFIKKNIYEKFGFYNTKYKYSADYEFLIRIIKNNVNIAFMEKIIANFRMGGVSYSAKAAYESNLIRYKYGFISLKRFILMLISMRIKMFFT